MALLTSLFATILLMALGLSVVLLGIGETTLALHDRESRALGYASRAAATLAITDLQALPSWAALLASGAPAVTSGAAGRFVDSTLTPPAPWGGSSLDLQALTAGVQADSDAASGGDTPLWRLFEYGPLDRLVPAASRANPYYLLVWVADDRADGDGDPGGDANGIVVVRAAAYGADGGKAVTQMSVMRQPVAGGPDTFRILTSRPWH